MSDAAATLGDMEILLLVIGLVLGVALGALGAWFVAAVAASSSRRRDLAASSPARTSASCAW